MGDKLRVRSKVIRLGSTIVNAGAIVRNAENRIVAKCSTSIKF
jgi:acyl-coenzyme A thioesterase PaaI-like protein